MPGDFRGGWTPGDQPMRRAPGPAGPTQPPPKPADIGRRRGASYVDGRPKPRPELLPAGALMAAASVMAAGEPEHGDRWRGHDAVHHVGAALRHLFRWLAGEPYDRDLQEQGHGEHSHLACAGARVLMALDIEIEGETRP